MTVAPPAGKQAPVHKNPAATPDEIRNLAVVAVQEQIVEPLIRLLRVAEYRAARGLEHQPRAPVHQEPAAEHGVDQRRRLAPEEDPAERIRRRTRRVEAVGPIFHQPEHIQVVRRVRVALGVPGRFCKRDQARVEAERSFAVDDPNGFLDRFRGPVVLDEIRSTVGNRQVVCGVSGGVDSTVLAVLLHEAA